MEPLLRLLEPIRNNILMILGEMNSSIWKLLWDYVQKYIDVKSGYLIADDTILDKPRGPKIEGVGFHYSGKHKRSVRGLCLVSLVWTDGKYVFPVDFRVYNKNDGVTKNEHLLSLIHI